MKDQNYNKCHFLSKNLSGCLEALCQVHRTLRNKMAILRVVPSRSDSYHAADSVPDPTTCMLPRVSLTESDTPGAFLKPSMKKAPDMSDSVKLTVGS